MEVKDMFKQPKFSKINSLLENRYGFSFDPKTLTRSSASRMLALVESKIAGAQRSGQGVEKNPAYCQMLVMRESLRAWMGEQQLNEGEIGEAEVVLAAKNLTDSIQKMIEQAGKIANEELPALSVAIRDQIGMSQATTYKQSAGAAVNDLLTQLNTARDALENSYLALTGQQVDTDMALPGAEEPIPGVPGETEEPMPSEDDFAASDAEAGGTEPLGRGRR